MKIKSSIEVDPISFAESSFIDTSKNSGMKDFKGKDSL